MAALTRMDWVVTFNREDDDNWPDCNGHTRNLWVTPQTVQVTFRSGPAGEWLFHHLEVTGPMHRKRRGGEQEQAGYGTYVIATEGTWPEAYAGVIGRTLAALRQNKITA